MFPTGFEPAIPASEQPHTHTLDRAATGISPPTMYLIIIVKIRHYFLMLTFIFFNYSISYHTSGARGGVVVKTLRYKPTGRGFDSR
jgi:hypothetical protein